MNRTRIWFVTPTYMDLESFLTLRLRLLGVLDDQYPQAEARFVVLDDSAGEDPRVPDVRVLEDVTLITAPFNLGHQRAIVHALRWLTPELQDTDLVVTLDSDGEDRPEDLPRLLQPVLAQSVDVRVVSLALRTKRQTTVAFKILYVFFRLLFRFLTGTHVQTGNYAAYRGRVAKRILPHPYFDLCYSSTLLALDLAVELVPCERGHRYAGQSRMGYGKLLMHGLRMLMPFIDRIAVRALLLFSVTFGLGVLSALVILGLTLFSNVSIPGWAIAALAATTVVSFVALGSFITLFAVFSQSRAISLTTIDRINVADPPARGRR